MSRSEKLKQLYYLIEETERQLDNNFISKNDAMKICKQVSDEIKLMQSEKNVFNKFLDELI